MLLDKLERRDIEVFAIGKISDVFLGRGIRESASTTGNADGMSKTLRAMNSVEQGLVFVNLVDFDQLYGHRNDVDGYARALEEVDAWLPELEEKLAQDDLVILTADHGCDPTTASTDHSREYVPVLTYGRRARAGVDLGLRTTLSDLGQTVAEIFGTEIGHGESFLSRIV